MSDQNPILVIGAAGKVSAVGHTVVERLRQHDLPVRALVRRHDVFDHFVTMARLHAQNRYDRMTHDVKAITGRPALTVRSYLESRPDLFGKGA